MHPRHLEIDATLEFTPSSLVHKRESHTPSSMDKSFALCFLISWHLRGDGFDNCDKRGRSNDKQDN